MGTGPTTAINDSTPAVPGLPLLLVGSVTSPGGHARATYWTPSPMGIGDPHPPPLDEAESIAGRAVVNGRTTVIAGHTWDDGVNEPFLLSSEDRRHWQPVDLPSEIGDRGLMIEELAGVNGHVVVLGPTTSARCRWMSPRGGFPSSTPHTASSLTQCPQSPCATA